MKTHAMISRSANYKIRVTGE